ncbi:MAG: phosphoenolpyruvate--protein phosphotransferase [Planctomycetes bacterium]|nr:phosphoenolpyruvate--protein phosphotransferase [Planctomycetota bacterium]
MIVKSGIAVSPGVATGPALVLGTEDFRIPQNYVGVDAIEAEVSRFQLALKAVCREIAENERLASERLGKQYGAIFGAHLQMARDPKLINEIENLIRERCFSPEYASSRILRKYARELQNLGNTFLAERAVDLYDLEKRILRHLLGERREELAQLTVPVIVLAHNLTPSETARLNTEFVLGFATEVGGRTSHTAILAGALEIPAIVGVGNFLSDVSGGDTIILDGSHGDVIVDPDEETRRKYRDSEAHIRSFSERLQARRPLRSETTDGTRIHLMGNIEFPEEVEHCTNRGADGIGLYRTEFLYLEKDHEPTETDHYEAYCRVAGACGDRPVVIRTLDLGADKVPGFAESLAAEFSTSVLGLRSIRLSLDNLLQQIAELGHECNNLSMNLSDEINVVMVDAGINTKIGGGFFRQLSGHDPNCPSMAALDRVQVMAATLQGEEAVHARRLITRLSRRCELLSRARKDVQYQALMQVFLFVHVPMSFALLAALSSHVFIVFFYW